MSRHLTIEEILDLLVPGAEPNAETEAHLEECDECRSRVEIQRPLQERLNALPREAEPPRDLWPAVRERVAAEPARNAVHRGALGRAVVRPWRVAALRAAAAVAVFVLGVAVGRATDGSGTGRSRSVADGDPLRAAAVVQRAGTDYVAAVARFRSIAGDRPTPLAEQAREAALSAVHGAAYELTRLRPGDPTARDIAVLAGERRLGEGAP